MAAPVYACAVSLIYYGTSKQGKEIGNRGAAITGDNKAYQLVCYDGPSQKQELSIPITAKASFSLLPGHFLHFRDENKEKWAVRASRECMMKLCQHITIVKSLVLGTLKAPLVQELDLGEGRVLSPGDAVKADVNIYKSNLDVPTQPGEIVKSWLLKRVKVHQGKGKVSKAIEDGLLGMKKNGKRVLIVPVSHLTGGKGEDDLSALGFPSLMIEIEVKKIKFATPDPEGSVGSESVSTTSASEPAMLLLTAPSANNTPVTTPRASSEPLSSIDRSSTLQVSEARAAFAAAKGMYNSAETSDHKISDTHDKPQHHQSETPEKNEQREGREDVVKRKPLHEEEQSKSTTNDTDDKTPLNAEFRMHFNRLDGKLKSLERNLSANLSEDSWDDGTVTIQGIISSFRALMGDRDTQAEINHRQAQQIDALRTRLDDALSKRAIDQNEMSDTQSQRIVSMRRELINMNEQVETLSKNKQELHEELALQTQKTSEAESKVEICLTRMKADRVKFNAHVEELQKRLSQLTEQLSAGTELNEHYRLQVAQLELKSKGIRSEAEAAELRELQAKEAAQAEAKQTRALEQARAEGFNLGKEEATKEVRAQLQAELQQAATASKHSEEVLTKGKAQAEAQLRQAEEALRAQEAVARHHGTEIESLKTLLADARSQLGQQGATLAVSQQARNQLEQELKQAKNQNTELETQKNNFLQQLEQFQISTKHQLQETASSNQQQKQDLSNALQTNQQLHQEVERMKKELALFESTKASLGGTLQSHQFLEHQLMLSRNEVNKLTMDLQSATVALANKSEEQQSAGSVAFGETNNSAGLLEEIALLTRQLAQEKIEKESLQQAVAQAAAGEKEKVKKEKKSKKDKKSKEEGREKKSKSREKGEEGKQALPQPPIQAAPVAKKEVAGAVFFDDLAAIDESNLLPEIDPNDGDDSD